MSMDPGMIQQMLASRLQQPQTQGGQQGQMSPMSAASQLMQKAMLVKALQSQQSTQNANNMLPATQAQMQLDPQMQALQQSPQMLQQQFPAIDPSAGQ